MNALPILQNYRTGGHDYRFPESVVMVTELQNDLPWLLWLQTNKTHCHVYRVTERVALVTD
jgi:hypothetical protein